MHGADESIRRHASQITTVALVGLRLGEDGAVTDQLDRNLLRLAHNEGLRTTAVLQDGGPRRVHSLAHDRAARSRLADALVRLCETEQLQGIHLAFDGLRDDWRDLEPITADLGHRLRRAQVELFVDVPPGIDGATLTALARLANGVVLMAFDEYDAGGAAGPIASDAFVEAALRSASARAPAAKLTAALALHGYDWPTGAPGRRISFGQARALARKAQTSLRREDGNLHLQFGDGDAHHESWVADAVSVGRQSHIAAAAKIRSLALWPLGDEDPEVWPALRDRPASAAPARTDGRAAAVAGLTPRGSTDSSSPPSSMRVAGRRPSHVRDRSIVDERGSTLSAPFAISHSPSAQPKQADDDRGAMLTDPFPKSHSRAAEQTRTTINDAHGLTRSAPAPDSHATPATPKKVALLFVDGPDVDSTPNLLDILARHHVPATFFATGTRIVRAPELIARIFEEGHELGNGTLSRALVDPMRSPRLRLALEATSRLLELLIGRRPRLLRQPAAPNERWPPAGLGYVAEGLSSEQAIVASDAGELVRHMLDQARRRGVIVLRDDRAAGPILRRALPEVIAQLQSRGVQLVPLSNLIGKQRDDVMPPAPARTRVIDRTTQLILRTVLMLSRGLPIILWLSLALFGTRALAVVVLAVMASRRVSRCTVSAPSPSVTVLIPVFNAQATIARTVGSVLASDIPLEVVIIDDGSTDGTTQLLLQRYRRQARVRLLRQLHAGPIAALMTGLTACQTEVVITLGAASVLSPDAARHLVEPLRDARVAVVSGHDRGESTGNMLSRWQALEALLHGQLAQRALGLLGILPLAPRALTAWRRRAVLEVRGFSSTTLAVEADLIMTLLARGWRAVHAAEAGAFVAQPRTLRALLRQRIHSSFGVLQVIWRHRPRRAPTNARSRTEAVIGRRHRLTWLALLATEVAMPLATLPAFGAAALSAWAGSFRPLLHVALFLFAVELVQLAVARALSLSSLGSEPTRRLLLSFVASQLIYRPIQWLIALRSIGRLVDGMPIGWRSSQRNAAAAYAAATKAFARR